MDATAIYDAVVSGQGPQVKAGVQAALDAGIPPNEILNEGLIAPMKEVGRRYECGDSYVAEMLLSARAMKNGLEVLRPILRAAQVESAGKVVIGTIAGDMHDIGKNLVGMMMEGAGFEVIDLGVDVRPAKFVEAVKKYQPNIVAISALLTTTMAHMKEAIVALEAADLRKQVKVMVGGAPLTAEFAQQIGADVYAPDASAAARRATELLTKA